MKKKSIMMMMAAMAFVFGMSSCGSDDDAPEAPLATQVAGSYSGNEVVIVDNEESSNETKTYQINKASDTSIDIVIPSVGMGMMTIPAVTVKNIPLVKDGNTIKGALANYEGTLTADDGTEKAYTVSNLVILFSDKTVVATFAEKYGRMPFSLYTTFTGTQK
ncbi:MAG: hypothetical protein II404_14050 [Prevotella sp.]|nr:hypothetical protein [Prevotella sp.]